MTKQTDETQIREVVKKWEKAVCDHDMDGVLANHTKDVVMFDVPPPLQRKGLEEYKQAWELYNTYDTGGEGTFKVLDLTLFISGDVAFGFSPLHAAGATARLTLGFRKENGEWLIAHEHHSFPAE